MYMTYSISVYYTMYSVHIGKLKENNKYSSLSFSQLLGPPTDVVEVRIGPTRVDTFETLSLRLGRLSGKRMKFIKVGGASPYPASIQNALRSMNNDICHDNNRIFDSYMSAKTREIDSFEAN